jgi:hypothetical protein
MRSARWKAILATRFQWVAVLVFVAASVPPLGLLLDPTSHAQAVAQNRLSGGLLATFASSVVVILLQARVAQDGCFGVCAYPPVARLKARATLWVRIAIQFLHWGAIVVVILTISRRLGFHLGLVLSYGLLVTWSAVFNATWLALGYDQTVPKGFRFLFLPDRMWMVRRMHGRIYVAERSCVVAVMDGLLRPGDRLLALELIALRPWVEGGKQALEAAADPNVSTELAARARELLATDFARPRETGHADAA